MKSETQCPASMLYHYETTYDSSFNTRKSNYTLLGLRNLKLVLRHMCGMKQHELIIAVNMATDTLGLYRAELARILGLHCQDVANSQLLESILLSDQDLRQRAEKFIIFYRLLEKHCAYKSVDMVHWFRVEHRQLATTPFLAIVDHDRLDDVIRILSK